MKRCSWQTISTVIDPVVDGEVGFIGGINIGDEYLGKDSELGYWRDTHFKIKGDAAQCRGVDVRVIIPAIPDSQLVYWASLSYVRELLQAGIRFYRYQKGFIHSKVIISDDAARSGSANMDICSFTGQLIRPAEFERQSKV